MEPVAVDPATVELVFGSGTLQNGLPNGSTLVKGFEEAYAAGCRDIRLMRITGEYAKTQVKAKKVSQSIEKPVHEKTIGIVEGNIESTFELNLPLVDENSVRVNIGGQTISPDKYVVVQGNDDPLNMVYAKIILEENVTDAGLSVFISYTNPYGTIERSENAHTETDPSNPTYWVTAGEDKTYTLLHRPIRETFKLYADGREADEKTFTVNQNEVTVKAGAFPKGTFLEATYLTAITEEFEPVLDIKAVYGGAVYNETKIRVEDIKSGGGEVVGKLLIITKPEPKKAQDAEEPLMFSSLDYPNFELMVNAINQHPKNNVVRASVSEKFKYHSTAELRSDEPEKNLQGGDDGINVTPYKLYEALGGKRDENGYVVEPGAYHLLENYNVDYIVPLGVYADEELPGKYDNFAYQLALACAVISHRNDTVLGVIPTKSPDEAGLKSVREHVDKLLQYNNNYFMRDRVGNILRGSDGKPIDLGRFITVIAGPDLIFGSQRFGLYSENSAAAYAGYMTTLPPHQAPTNKPINFALGMRYSFSNAQLDKLTESRFVTYKYKNNGTQIAVTDAMTAAQPDSDYRRQNTVRVVKAVVDAVRRVADPYIGQPNEIAQRNALSSAIQKELDSLKELGVISGSEFNLVATPQDILLGQLKIELTLVPPQELRRITTIVSLRPSL
ncbi:MAG: hypothetical protein N2043_02225 [Ignavibacterium sp.]|nr:hypothetical protein [Ignavibacterium sp.]